MAVVIEGYCIEQAALGCDVILARHHWPKALGQPNPESVFSAHPLGYRRDGWLRPNAPVLLQASQIKARGEATRNPKIARQLQRSLAIRRGEPDLKRRQPSLLGRGQRSMKLAGQD